jgi:hypothetical protein
MDGPARVVPLTIELEAALLRELAAEYNNLSWAFFSSRLQQPTIELVDSAAHLGRWVPRVRTIELSRAFVLTRPWGVVVEVLKHEMAHQAVEDLLGVRDETAHGPAFRLLCQQLGIDPSARGEPSGASVRDEAESRVLERVAKLLALAESSNEHEAQAAMSAAQKLLLKYNLDTAVPKGGRAYGFRHVGRATGRVSEAERLLAAILGEHFFVQVIWVPIYRPYDGKRGRVLELCGTPREPRLRRVRPRLPLGHLGAPLGGAQTGRGARLRSGSARVPGGRDDGLPREAPSRAQGAAGDGPRVGRRRGSRRLLPTPPPAHLAHALRRAHVERSARLRARGGQGHRAPSPGGRRRDQPRQVARALIPPQP